MSLLHIHKHSLCHTSTHTSTPHKCRVFHINEKVKGLHLHLVLIMSDKAKGQWERRRHLYGQNIDLFPLPPFFLSLSYLLSIYHSILPQSYCFNCTLINFPRISMCLPTFNSSLCMFESRFILSGRDLVSPADWAARVHASARDVDEYPTVALCELRQTEKGNACSERADGS